MPDSAPLSETETDAPGITWRVKLVVALLVVLAVAVVLGTNRWLSERFTEVTRNRAELRLALYSISAVVHAEAGASREARLPAYFMPVRNDQHERLATALLPKAEVATAI